MIMGLNVRTNDMGTVAKVTVPGAMFGVTWQATDEGRNVYSWDIMIVDDGETRFLASGDVRDGMIRSGVGADVDALAALVTLISFAEHDGEAYGLHMGVTVPDDGYLFGDVAAELFYMHADRLSVAAWGVADAQESTEYVM